MRKQTIRTILLLAVMFIGALTAVNNSTVKEAKAMPYTLFLQEYHLYYPDVLTEIQTANQTARYLATQFNGVSTYIAPWNNSMLSLIFWLQEIDTELKVLPYTHFSMDKLLLKVDIALSYGIQAAKPVDNLYTFENNLLPGCGNPPICDQIVGLIGELSSRTHTIVDKVTALGFLFTKAKLEMLEFPRLSCFPLQVAVAGKLYCSGQSVNGTATLQINNTQTGAMTKIGQSQADSFFDVFFEVTLPPSIGTGHWQAVITDSGGAQASSFFDVFVTLPTAFEPTTIIPLTVLIAAVATLAVASRKVRRLN